MSDSIWIFLCPVGQEANVPDIGTYGQTFLIFSFLILISNTCSFMIIYWRDRIVGSPDGIDGIIIGLTSSVYGCGRGMPQPRNPVN